MARRPWFAYDLLCIPFQSTNRPYGMLCQGALHIYSHKSATHLRQESRVVLMLEDARGHHWSGTSSRQPPQIRTCHCYLCIIRSRSKACADCRHRMSPPAAVRSRCSKPRWTGIRTRAGILAFVNLAQASASRHETTSLGLGLPQSDTRILRPGREGFLSVTCVFKADGPSVLAFLLGGVEADRSAVSVRAGDLDFLQRVVNR